MLIPLFCHVTHIPKAATILNHSTVSVWDPENGKDSVLGWQEKSLDFVPLSTIPLSVKERNFNKKREDNGFTHWGQRWDGHLIDNCQVGSKQAVRFLFVCRTSEGPLLPQRYHPPQTIINLNHARAVLVSTQLEDCHIKKYCLFTAKTHCWSLLVRMSQSSGMLVK